jgi:hypothetical protein
MRAWTYTALLGVALLPLQQSATVRVTVLGLILGLASASGAHGGTDVFAPLLGRRIDAQCRMDYCYWLRLERARLIGRSPKGELYEVTTRRWLSRIRSTGRVWLKPDGEQTDYVFCSKTMPAYMGVDRRGKKEGGLIFPGTGAVTGISQIVYVLYWAACHRTASPEAELDSELAKRFGYNLSNPEALTVKPFQFESPSDALKW